MDDARDDQQKNKHHLLRTSPSQLSILFPNLWGIPPLRFHLRQLTLLPCTSHIRTGNSTLEAYVV